MTAVPVVRFAIGNTPLVPLPIVAIDCGTGHHAIPFPKRVHRPHRRAMLEAIARLDRRLMIGARRWLTGRTIVDAVARLGWKAIVDARRRLVR
jgi:hypothetical protein